MLTDHDAHRFKEGSHGLLDEKLGGQGLPALVARNDVSLDPQRAPVHVFCLRRRVRSERDFDSLH